MNAHLIINRIPLALVALTAILAIGAVGAASDAKGMGPGAYGYKKANQKQKRALKRVAAPRVRNQRAWYVSRSRSPQFGVVCGRVKRRHFRGAAFKVVNGRWKFHKTITSGGMQTVMGLCSL